MRSTLRRHSHYLKKVTGLATVFCSLKCIRRSLLGREPSSKTMETTNLYRVSGKRSVQTDGKHNSFPHALFPWNSLGIHVVLSFQNTTGSQGGRLSLCFPPCQSSGAFFHHGFTRLEENILHVSPPAHKMAHVLQHSSWDRLNQQSPAVNSAIEAGQLLFTLLLLSPQLIYKPLS